MCKWKYSESNSRKELSGSKIFNTLENASNFLIRSVNAVLYPDTIESVFTDMKLNQKCNLRFDAGYLKEATIFLPDGSDWKGRITKVND